MTYEDIITNIDRKLYEVDHGYSERDLFDDLVEVFKLDPTNPITTRMHGKAWESGHSGGLREVVIHFSDLVEVFKG